MRPELSELQRAYRWLIAGLLLFELAHVIAVATMLVFLLPGLDPARSPFERAAYVATHPWSWRLGWLPWQLCAVSDAWVAAALIGWLRAARAPLARRWALLGAAFLLIAIVPEQYAELALVTGFVGAPPTPAWSEQLSLYMWLTGSWAATGYTLMTACWLLALRRLATERKADAGSRSVWPAWAEVALLLAFAGSAVANHFAWAPHASADPVRAFRVASLLNGLGFPGLLLLGLAMALFAGDFQRSRTGGPNPPSWPVAGSRAGRALASIAGSAGLRDLVRAAQRWMPFPTLRSDVSDVLYLNWIVDADALEARVPAGMRVQRFGSDAVLSVLVYRHGHFGPARLGPLRRWLPSPLQCNVRAYVQGAERRVVFLCNAIDHPAYFAGSRLLSDGLPVHYAAAFGLTRTARRVSAVIDPGAGSALALRATVDESSAEPLPAAFARHFAGAGAAMDYIVPQNAGELPLPTVGLWCESSIVVDVPRESLRGARVIGPIALGVPLAALVEGAQPFAFVAPRVRFEVRGERTVRRPTELYSGSGV